MQQCVSVCVCVTLAFPILLWNIIEAVSAFAEVRGNANENSCSKLRAPTDTSMCKKKKKRKKGRSDDPGLLY